MVLDTVHGKYRQKGIAGLMEAVWRNSLRRTPLGSLVEYTFGETLVEKLVMAPRIGYWPRIREPRSFNEKIMHRKLYTDEDIFAVISDKQSVRSYVRSKVGESILNEVYYISEDPRSIPFDSLPDEFVIKTGNKGIVIVDDKTERTASELIEASIQSFDESFGYDKGEYWYAKTEQKYMVEKRLYGTNQSVPLDYKFFVFHGDVKCIQVDYNRFAEHSRRLYLPDWTPLDVKLKFPLGPITQKPENLEYMIRVAEQLGEDFDFMRVDLFETQNNGIIFGELTPAPGNGGERFDPKGYDFKLGQYWNKCEG